MYSYARFFTMTGWHLQGTTPHVEARQEALDEVHGRVFGPQPITRTGGTIVCYCPPCDYLATLMPNGACPSCSTPPLSAPTGTAGATPFPAVLCADTVILDKARAAKNGAKFTALWAGDTTGYGSQSEADLAVCVRLAFWTQDAAQIDRLFRQSGLLRPKWDEQRGAHTYGERTIAEALARQSAHYTPAGGASLLTQATPQAQAGQNGQAPQPAWSQPAWMAGLLTSKNGQPLESFGNLTLCIANTPRPPELWYDLVGDCAMVGEAPLDEPLIAQAALAIERGVRLPIRNLKLVRTAIVAHCRTSPRDPIKEWLEALPPWDGQPRLLTWMPDYTGAAGTAYVQETGRLWLVSMVARALKPGCQCRSVIVLMGDENIGKSALVKCLATEAWYRDVSGSLEGKEAHMLMKGVWLVELGELSSLGKTEENRLKSFITMANDGFIPKYANDPVKLARRAILVGTLNPEGDKTFLRGQTGNTRYSPVAVTAINLAAVEALRAPLFAEALAYYQDHPDDWWKLTPTAEAEARAIRDDHRVRSVYEEPLSAWLVGRTLTCWQEICEHFLLLEAKERWKDTKLQKDIALAMVACGWQQEKLRRVAPFGHVRPWVRR